MSTFAPISHSTHKSAGWDLISNYEFAAGDALVPISFSEAPRLLQHYVTAFYRNTPEEPLQMVAILGLFPGQNLYVSSRGEWIGNDVPAVYRGYPFRLLPVEESDKVVLCVDESSQNYKASLDEDSQPLFGADGKISDLTSRVKEFLVTQYQHRTNTEALLKLLDECGVLQPWHIKVDGIPETIAPHSGLYHVNEAKLKALPADQLQGLAASGALGLAYAQILSEHRIQDLAKLMDMHSQNAETNGTEDGFDLQNFSKTARKTSRA